MIKFFAAMWVIGLLTIVPYGTYYLLFEASRDQYALVGVFVVFWVLGYWALVTPLISAVKAHKIMTSIQSIKSKDELLELINNDDSRDAAIELIASEIKVPEFIAKQILNRLIKAYRNNGQTT